MPGQRPSALHVLDADFLAASPGHRNAAAAGMLDGMIVLVAAIIVVSEPGRGNTAPSAAPAPAGSGLWSPIAHYRLPSLATGGLAAVVSRHKQAGSGKGPPFCI